MSASMMPDISTVRALLHEIGMVVAEEHIIPVNTGSINHTFRILQGEQQPPLFLRIAPSDAEVDAGPDWMTSHGLRQEQTVIGMAGPLQRLLPRVVHADWSRTLISRDWILQTSVNGRPWTEIEEELPADQNLALWRQLGELVSQLHQIRGAEFGPPVEGLGHECWSDLVRWDVTGLLVDAHRFEIDPAPFQLLVELVNASVKVLDEVDEPRLVHSDLQQHHVFVRRRDDGEVEISGLIDLEFARFADPGSESIFVRRVLGEVADDAFAAFCEGYACRPPSHNERTRLEIYVLTALGWTATDLYRTGQLEHIPAVLAAMRERLGERETGF